MLNAYNLSDTPLSILLHWITYNNCIKSAQYPYVEGTLSLFPHFTAEETLHTMVRKLELSVRVEARIWTLSITLQCFPLVPMKEFLSTKTGKKIPRRSEV